MDLHRVGQWILIADLHGPSGLDRTARACRQGGRAVAVGDIGITRIKQVTQQRVLDASVNHVWSVVSLRIALPIYVAHLIPRFAQRIPYLLHLHIWLEQVD